MTLDKAIQILSLLFGHIYDGCDLDRDKALKLGIEALKRIEEARIKYHSVWGELLPGETRGTDETP